jgi:hypothetical protein
MTGSSGDERGAQGVPKTSCRLRGEPEYGSFSDTVRSNALSPLAFSSSELQSGLGFGCCNSDSCRVG